MPRGKLKSTKEADRLLERLRARGHPLYSDDPDLPFAFFISGSTTLDVGEDWRRITNQFQIEMVERLRHKEFGSSLTGLILFPTILNPSIAISDDYARWIGACRCQHRLCIVDHRALRRKDRLVSRLPDAIDWSNCQVAASPG